MIHVIAAECVEHCTFVKSYWGILSDPAHLAAEVTIEVASAVLGFLVGVLPVRRLWRHWVRRHDEQHHAGHTSGEG